MRSFIRTYKEEETLCLEAKPQPGTPETLLPKVIRPETQFELTELELLGCNYTKDELRALFDSSLFELSIGSRQLLSVPCSSLRGSYPLLHPITIDSGDILRCRFMWDTTRLDRELYIRLSLKGVSTKLASKQAAAHP